MAVSTCKVKWDKSMSVEDTELDEQHIRLLEFTNKLLLSYSDKDDDSVVLNAINSLVDYSYYHFKYEEEVMKERGYPYLERHIELHNGFRTKIDKFKKKLGEGDGDVMDHLILYLISWAKNHMVVEDLDYKNYM